MPTRFEVDQFFSRSVPFALSGDAYTVAGQAVASPRARERSVYNLTNRRSPSAAWPSLTYDSRMIFYGLSHWVRECLRPDLVTDVDTDAADRFMDRAHSSGGRLNFDAGLLGRFAGRNLPIKVEGLAEGSVFWPNEPAVQVTSLGDGFGEVAALVEATLLGMVSCATARATVTRQLYRWCRLQAFQDDPGMTSEEADEVCSFMVHDFGMRASATPLEAVILGEAHLLSFKGTDTTPAAYSAWLDSGDDLGDVGTSILAHAHRIVLGYDTEGEAVEALADAALRCGDQPVASYLADTYDFRDFVDRLMVPLALKFRERGRGCAVVRSDSGDALANDDHVIRAAVREGLFEADRNGRWRANHLKVIHGDSLDPAKMEKILEGRRHGDLLHATSWGGFGVGGWLRAQSNRDALSSAYKLAECGNDRKWVAKLSDTPAKMSVPGEVVLTRDPEDPDAPTVWPAGTPGRRGVYRTYYDGSVPGHLAYGDVLMETFTEKRRRVRDEFFAYRHTDPDKGGGECPVLSPPILAFQDKVMAEHGRKRGVGTSPGPFTMISTEGV